MGVKYAKDKKLQTRERLLIHHVTTSKIRLKSDFDFSLTKLIMVNSQLIYFPCLKQCMASPHGGHVRIDLPVKCSSA